MNQAKKALWMQQKGHVVLAIGQENSSFQKFCAEHHIQLNGLKSTENTTT
jgi:hypothetical protein